MTNLRFRKITLDTGYGGYFEKDRNGGETFLAVTHGGSNGG